jgi:type IV pilus assembly protein PilY1
MKTALQACSSAAAAAALMFGVAAHATNLAELPLKASVLAKPNVIFGMDDSGSMDWEVALRTDNGLVHWRFNSATGFGSAWDATNNRPHESSPDFSPLAYNFPMGTGTGGQIYGVTNQFGRPIPPIAQLAWTRSNAFNPLYYNTMVTYPAWSPAYVSGAMRSYANASTTAAPSHPGPLGSTPTSLNVGADFDSTSTNWSANADTDFTFRVLAGMTLPAGTRVLASSTTSGVCSGSTVRTLSATTTVPSGASCRASIPYYPATFWQRTVCPSGDTACVPAPDCTAQDPNTTPGATCVASPDGLGKLRRYEIRSGNTFPSGRSHAAELQNFANWFTYYRKRKLMLAGAMGRVLEPITGLRLGVVPFNNRTTVTMRDADATSAASNRYEIAGRFYLNSMATNGTPTHATMKHIGTQFDTNTGIVQFACQRNAMFVVTDGFANAHSETAPSYDAARFGSGPPYSTTFANSLADFALAYYTNRLRASGGSALTAGRVPSGDPARPNPDLNTDLHVNTYGITLGARGTLFPSALNPFETDVFASPPTWPTPVADDPTMIDDLWHATINGRGQMYLANDVESMRLAIQGAFDDILSQQGAQSSVAVSSVNLDRGDSQAYLASYNPSGWVGDLIAAPVDKATAAIDTALANRKWSAAELLAARDWTTRIVFSAGSSGGMDFSTANVGAAVNPDSANFTDAQVVEYLRGNRDGEGDLFRKRQSLIGAVVNAEPVLARDEAMVYLAAGSGMLHAFDTVTGKEEWAFAPPDGLANLGKSVQRGWVYQTLLDATPAYARLSGGGKLLVGGMGAAGRSYYALDVSSPKNKTAATAAAQFRWVFPAAGDTTNRGRMGFTIGKPVITRTAADGDVVLVTSGVDNGQTIGDGKGRLWMLDAATGTVLKTFRTTDGTAGGLEAGLVHVSAFKEDDGTVRYAYGGDLLGNLWRFDLATSGAGEHVAELVATLRDAAGNAQPVTAAPELALVSGKRVILVGTGRLLDISDFGSTRTQTFYAIADGTTLLNARTSLAQQAYTRGSGGSGTVSASPVNWSTGRGWYMDLPSGEQANTDPIVTYGAVAFVTNRNGASDCSQESYLYLLDIGTGALPPTATTASWLIAQNATSSRVITLRVVNGKIIGTTHRSDNTVFQTPLPIGASIDPSKNAWREVRR